MAIPIVRNSEFSLPVTIFCSVERGGVSET